MYNIFLEVILMDYFSVIILIIVTFVFVSDRNVKSIEDIRKNKNDIDSEIQSIKSNIEIINVSSLEMNYNNVIYLAQNSKEEYVLLKNREIDLKEEDIDIIIANYVSTEKRTCGFNLLYEYNEVKWSLKKLYIDIINYLNIFNKYDLSTYGIIICTKNNLALNEQEFKQKLLTYTPAEFTDIEYNKQEISASKLKRIYINKLTKSNVSIIVKILLLIISGSIITTNLIYSVLNVNNNISGVIISAVIYYCYSYIIRYIYKPVGKQRIVATYIFPIYFIAYIGVTIYTGISKVIKKVHAS